MFKEIFIVFIAAHLIGDFVLQTNGIAKMKSENRKGVLIHSFIVMGVQVAFLSVYGVKGISAGVVSGILHYFIDYFKFMIESKLNKQVPYFLFDQLMHIGVILVLCLFLINNNAIEISVTYIETSKIITIFILLTYVSTVFVKILIKDIFKSENYRVLFQLHERIIDAIFCWAIYLILYFSMEFNIILVIFITYLYSVLNKKLYESMLKVILTKSLAYIIIAVSLVEF